MSGAIFCPYRGCGTAVASERTEEQVCSQHGTWVAVQCDGCGKAYSVKVHTVVEYETEILEDDQP